MGMTNNNLCNSCTNIGCEFQSGIVRKECAFYMPPQLEPDNCGNYVVQDSTTKNDIRDNRVKNELNRVKDELEPTTKNDLAVDCIDRVELLKAMNTYDKFGNDSNERLVFLSTPALQDRYVPYVHYDEMVNCVKGMPTVTPQEPKTGYISIDDVMSVFDDFMCGEVDEEGTETFLEMLKDKAGK